MNETDRIGAISLLSSTMCGAQVPFDQKHRFERFDDLFLSFNRFIAPPDLFV